MNNQLKSQHDLNQINLKTNVKLNDSKITLNYYSFNIMFVCVRHVNT